MRAKPAAPAARTSTSGGLTACPAPRVARGSAPTLRRATPVPALGSGAGEPPLTQLLLTFRSYSRPPFPCGDLA
jgi:hypothetical protein